ncbi:ATP-binding cassette domain-containing protein [Candidatus Chlorohelix sp.]|uniref:ABC transporter permease subunit n=1 Tax=Candidatus Chlorohelix sp. TaxID=3139201 RepID=UPI00303EC3CD
MKFLLRKIPFEAKGLLVIAGVAFILTGLVEDYQATQWTVWVIYGLLALSLTLVWGKGGIFSLGQVAFFGIGGYAYGVVGVNLIHTTGESLSALVAAGLLAALFAAAQGFFMFYGNVGDVYIAVITLATTLVLYTFMLSTSGRQYAIGIAYLGGFNGMTNVPPLTLFNSFLSQRDLLLVTIIIAAAIAFVVRFLLRRPFGRVIAGLRTNELRTQLLGYDTRRYKLLLYMLGGGIAGLAGGFYAAWGQFISPTVFSLSQASLAVIYVLVGGRASLSGAFAGAILVEGLSTNLSKGGTEATPIVLGLVMILIVLLLPTGIAPALATLLKRIQIRGGKIETRGLSPLLEEKFLSKTIPTASAFRKNSGRLETVELRKTFGGLVAVANASLTFDSSGVYCLIGPNGAGKSTYFNLLIGRYKPTSGQALFAGKPLNRMPIFRRVQQGMGIKLQVVSIFTELSVFENMWLAAYAISRNSLWAEQQAGQLLERFGLLQYADEQAGTLAHGQQQWLEIGMVLAQEPSVIMLDEPTAGMTREETARTAELVRELGKQASVIVVEHDMEFVRLLDAPVTVFHQGQIFAKGRLEELRQNEDLQNIYLGRYRNVEVK